MKNTHYAILINSKSEIKAFIKELLEDPNRYGLIELKDKNGQVFSDHQLNYFINKEERHGLKIITAHTEQSLISMSSGERKKVLLNYILKSNPEYLILINPYDNLDISNQEKLRKELIDISKRLPLVQIISRKEDVLPITTHFAKIKGTNLIHYINKKEFLDKTRYKKSDFSKYKIPSILNQSTDFLEELVRLKDVSVSFNDKPILYNINWNIKSGEFWQLIGPNGSGKTTLLSLITGDSEKGYGQDFFLFGRKKGSGESVWDIKKNIGYFTSSMMDKFRGYHTVESMLLSGLHDSIGLYVKPSETEKKLVFEWLELLNFNNKKDIYFHELSTLEKRVVMTTRAMIKNPSLLILDEPTVGLDDENALLFVSLVNKIASKSTTTIIFVSHRKEKDLQAQKVFELIPSKNGYTGKIH